MQHSYGERLAKFMYKLLNDLKDIYFKVSKKMSYVVNFIVFVTAQGKLIHLYVIFELLLKIAFLRFYCVKKQKLL